MATAAKVGPTWKTTIWPWKMAKKWGGSLPMVTCTCTRAPWYMRSSSSALSFRAAISRLVAWWPCRQGVGVGVGVGRAWSNSYIPFSDLQLQGWEVPATPPGACAPATGTGCTGCAPSSGMCRGQGSSCLHKAVHAAWGPQAACLSPGCTTPGEQGPTGTGGSSIPTHPVPGQEALRLICAGKGLAPNSAPTPCSLLGLCKDLQVTLSPVGPRDPPHLCRAVLSQESELACGA